MYDDIGIDIRSITFYSDVIVGIVRWVRHWEAVHSAEVEHQPWNDANLCEMNDNAVKRSNELLIELYP